MSSSLPPGAPLPAALTFTKWRDLDRSVAVDFHMHTTYTDGTGTVAEMVEGAVQAGVREILFSEHVRHTSEYFPQFASEVRSVTGSAVTARCGAEAKILDLAGTLDCSPDVASMCDAIIGSVHSAPPGNDGLPRSWSQMSVDSAVQLEYDMAMAIVASSRAHILGHPMGMSITRLKANPLKELRNLADACRAAGKAFELNARYCTDAAAWIDIVTEAECLISIGSDAHLSSHVGRAWRVFALAHQNIS